MLRGAAAAGRVVDVGRRARVLNVLRTVSDGEGRPRQGQRRAPPRAAYPRAPAALDAVPPRLDTPLVFPAPAGGLLNLDDWGRRVWAPRSRLRYRAPREDLRPCAAHSPDAPATDVSVFELVPIMGASVRMIERPLRRAARGRRGGDRRPRGRVQCGAATGCEGRG